MHSRARPVRPWGNGAGGNCGTQATWGPADKGFALGCPPGNTKPFGIPKHRLIRLVLGFSACAVVCCQVLLDDPLLALGQRAVASGTGVATLRALGGPWLKEWDANIHLDAGTFPPAK